MTRLLLLFAALAGPALSFAQTQDSEAGPGSAEAPLTIEIPDSLRQVYTSSRENPLVLEIQQVTARRVIREAGADRVEIGTLLIDSQDGGSVADLGALLPSTQLTINSRGEALFLVRGAQERHLRVELDDIPLTVPWDERTDLGLLPLIGVGSIVAHRGVSSALDPPNTLAGRIEMRTRRQTVPGHLTRLQTLAGEGEAIQSSLLHQRRDGAWTTTAALEHRRREGILLPGDADLRFHQDPTRQLRLNTDLEQTTFLGHFGRDVGQSGGLRLLVQASTAEKGVAPEAHVEDARFWRYPETQRLLFGLSGDASRSGWTVRAATSLDLHEQAIESYTDATYTTVDTSENDEDRTWLGRLRVERALGEHWSLATRASARNTAHEDDTGEAGATLEIEQNLVAAGGELTFRPRNEWTLRAGGGYEGATTPQTGDKPGRDGDHEGVWHGAVEYDLGTTQQFHATVSRRPRFVSPRELFSGALGRFVANPDLGPEIQLTRELGWSWRESRWEIMANGFWTTVDGSIEQVSLPGGQRQRVNADVVRSLGVELGLVARPLRGMTLDFQHTQMLTRAEEDGDFDARVADRPDWLSTLAASYVHPVGLMARVEFTGVGVRHSLDDRKAGQDDQLTAIDPSLRLNLRLGWRHFGTGWYEGSEIFARVDNVLDAKTESQIGLPESGRMLRLGLRVDLGS